MIPPSAWPRLHSDVPAPSFVVGAACLERRGGSIVVTERSYGPGIRTDEHAHDYASLDVVLSGAARDRYLGKERVGWSGSVLWYAPEAGHVWRSGEAGARVLHTIIPRGWLDGETAREGEGVAEPGPAHRLRRALREGDSRLEIESLAVELWDAWRGMGVRLRGRPVWLGRVIEMLHGAGAERLSLGELAAEAGISPGHMTRVFRARVGCSPGEFTRRVRVHRAAMMLSEGRGECITAIAHALGFADHAHLTRVFRREVGCTPSAYRAVFVGG